MTLNKKTYRGFTLIELMVVMAIIAILATLIVGAIVLARNTATETANRSNAKTIQTALEGQFAKYREYCSTSAAPGEIACASYSLDGVRAAIYTATSGTNSIQLGGGSSGGSLGTGGTAGTGSENGGGRVMSLSGNAYAILVSNAAGNNWTSLQDAIQVNMGASTYASLPSYTP